MKWLRNAVVFAVAVISVANTIGYSYLYKTIVKDSVSLSDGAENEKNDETENKDKEKATEKTAEKSENVEKETDNEKDNAKEAPKTDFYSVKNIACAELGYNDLYSYMQYDTDTHILYYYDEDDNTLNSYNLNTEERKSETINWALNQNRVGFLLNPYDHMIYNSDSGGAFFLDKDTVVKPQNIDDRTTICNLLNENIIQSGDAYDDTNLSYSFYDSRVILHNNDYYYIVRNRDGNDYFYYLFKTVQLIPSKPSTIYTEIANSSSIVSVRTTLNDIYYFTKNTSFYRMNIDNPGEDELLIQGTEIENTGLNYVSDQITDFLYISDDCFVVYDALDNTIKLIGNPPEADEITLPTESSEEKPETNYSDAAWVDENGMLQIDFNLIGKDPSYVGDEIGKEVSPKEWTYWGNDLTFWEDDNDIGFMFQNNELVIVTYDNGTKFDNNILNAAKSMFSGSVSNKTQYENPYVTIDTKNNCNFEMFIEYYTDTKDYHFRQRYVSKSIY